MEIFPLISRGQDFTLLVSIELEFMKTRNATKRIAYWLFLLAEIFIKLKFEICKELIYVLLL